MGLTQDPNFEKLQHWYTAHALNLNMRHMFEADKERFRKFRYANIGFLSVNKGEGLALSQAQNYVLKAAFMVVLWSAIFLLSFCVWTASH